MINKAFNSATLKLLKSTQIIYYKLHTPSIEDISVIYKQGDDIQFEAAMTCFKAGKTAPNGDDLLHHFNQFYDPKIIDKILSFKKISPNTKNGNGETALTHLAKISSKEENGKLLNKEQVKVISSEYFDRIYEINNQIKSNSVEIAKLYIKDGVDVNLHDIFGNTAIYYALKKNNQELALLIAKTNGFDASIKFREDDYKDAFDLAIECNSNELALNIFLSMTPEQKQNKMFDIKTNLYIPESLILACESITDVSQPTQEARNKEVLKAQQI